MQIVSLTFIVTQSSIAVIVPVPVVSNFATDYSAIREKCEVFI